MAVPKRPDELPERRAADPEREARRAWRRLWLFGLPVAAPAAGVILHWRDGLDVIRGEIVDAERVEAALKLADELGLRDEVERWISRPRWSPS
jgi:hypothetical protein